MLMISDKHRQLAQRIINKDKWWDILSKLIDVIRINMFIVDRHGLIILPPDEARYGGRLLTDKKLGFELIQGQAQLLTHFRNRGEYLESINKFDLRSYALPINFTNNEVLAYLITGPVILNKRLISQNLKTWAHEISIGEDVLYDEINQIRVVSNVMMKSILDLLSGIVKDNIQLSMNDAELNKFKEIDHEHEKAHQLAEEIYTTVRQDELLINFLDVVLNMTETECGSIMVIDEKTQEMTVKLSKGLESKEIQNKKIKCSEGISGYVALKGELMVIDRMSGEDSVRSLLKRSEIQKSLIMPIKMGRKIFGVINVHTKKERCGIDSNLDNLVYLANLLSSAL